ncbi:MAG: sulfatase-like hydrolase/transferase [Phycisphaerales bacterium]|nr:sulfatase-like hydrolase/transferase [Phycisphaerales bacterium]
MNKTTRRDFLSLSALAAVGGAALALAGRHSLLHGAGRSGGKPNVIVFLVDDMGWIDSATYGSKYYQTPNMTRLAKRGVLFTDAYAASPLCSPTRASIMSGQYPARMGLTVAITPKCVANPKALPANGNSYCGRVQGRDRMPLEIYTLAEALKDGGYTTAHIGKWHLAPNRDGQKFYADNQGFDFVIGGAHLPGPPDYYSPYARKGRGIRNLKPGPKGEYLNERLAGESIKWIDSVKDSGKPFYLNFWHYAVHSPIIPKRDLMPKYTKRRDPKNVQRCPEMATMLESMDTSLGILLDFMDRPENRELKSNTLLIFTSDNGGMIHKEVKGNQVTSNRPLRGGKGNTYEGGIREPWIVKPGTVCRTPVQSTDIYPTVLEAAGLKRRASIPLDGRSIVPLLNGEAMERGPIFTHFPHDMGALCAPSTSVRAGDWKLIRFYHAGKNAASHAYELFDLKRDPSEAINLAAYFPEKVRELDQLIESFLEDTEALVPLGNSKYKGDPQATRTAQSLNKAPKRPRSLRLPGSAIKTAKEGNRRIQLTDQDDQARQTHALVLEGSEWVRVRNNDDGSVELRWDAAPKNGSAKILFGWKGGTIPQEINSATIPPCELELSARGSKITHEYEFTMPSPSQSAAKAPAPKRRWQDQFFKNRDRNGDGAITLEEFIGNPKGRNVPSLTKRFKKIDSNGDGKLLLEELKKQTR